MYLYFSSNGTLKEIINDKPLRQNSSGWNTIYAYFEENLSTFSVANGLIKYTLGNGNDYESSGTNWIEASGYVNEQIPFNQYRDLKNFQYYKNYYMFKFVVPDSVLAITGTLGICVRVVDSDDNIISMQRVAVEVEENAYIGGVYSGENAIAIDTTISVAEYNDLTRRLVSMGEKVVFVTYGTTSYDEIQALLDADKLPVLYYNSRLYIHSRTFIDSISYQLFSCVEYNEVYYAYVIGSLWSANKYTLENTVYKVTSISSSSTDSQYPSAKCVYDLLETKQNTLTFDDTPIASSDNPVKSGGVYESFAYVFSNYYSKNETNTLLGTKQATLVSGTNIKTINNNSILGSGNVNISGSGGGTQLYLHRMALANSDDVVFIISTSDTAFVWDDAYNGYIMPNILSCVYYNYNDGITYYDVILKDTGLHGEDGGYIESITYNNGTETMSFDGTETDTITEI